MDDQNKKKFSCSSCGYEAISKNKVERHIKSKNLHKNETNPLSVIETPTITCKLCQASVKTMTKINHMEKHLKTCSGKASIVPEVSSVINNIHNTYIQNNYINIILNRYDDPTTRYLVYSENLVQNRVEIFKQVYLNENIPQNHSLVYDKENHKIKIYSNNDYYTSVDLGCLSSKISTPLDIIQQQLLDDNVTDKKEVKRITDLIDATYDEYETKNKYRYGEIVRNYQDIPNNTRRIIDKEKEQEKLKDTPS